MKLQEGDEYEEIELIKASPLGDFNFRFTLLNGLRKEEIRSALSTIDEIIEARAGLMLNTKSGATHMLDDLFFRYVNGRWAEETSEVLSMVDDLNLQKNRFFRGELARLNSNLSDFTNRIGVLLTTGSLLSFLPSLLGVIEVEYLPHFLLWSFPFLLLAIVSYYPSSLRVQSVIKGIVFAQPGTGGASKILEDRTEYLELVWRKTVDCYDNALSWYKGTNALMYAYLFSLSTNFYIFVFWGEPSLFTSIVVALASLTIILMMLSWSKIMSLKRHIIGGVESDVAVGTGVTPSYHNRR